jgi:hypothetical protein
LHWQVSLLRLSKAVIITASSSTAAAAASAAAAAAIFALFAYHLARHNFKPCASVFQGRDPLPCHHHLLPPLPKTTKMALVYFDDRVAMPRLRAVILPPSNQPLQNLPGVLLESE